MFEFAEGTLDEVVLAIEAWIDRSLDLAIALAPDVRVSAALAKQVDQVLPVITAVRNNEGCWQSFEQVRGDGFVRGLSLRES